MPSKILSFKPDNGLKLNTNKQQKELEDGKSAFSRVEQANKGDQLGAEGL